MKRRFIYLVALMLACHFLPVRGQAIAYQPKRTQAADNPLQNDHAKDKTLESVLNTIQAKYRISILYESQLIENKKVGSEPELKGSADQVLQLLLKPLQLTFRKSDKVYVIIKNEHPDESSLQKIETIPIFSANKVDLTQHQPLDPMTLLQLLLKGNASSVSTIKGKVTDDHQQGIPGVSVLLKGTTTGTSTDVEGNYSLNVPDATGTLVFSYIGYVTEEVAIRDQMTINMVLLPDIQSLSEVVVVGYGTQKKANLTGSVVSVSANELTKRPATHVGNLLQGKVTGLQVVQSSGEPGNDSPVIRLRGLGTFSGAGSDPLVLVNGVQGSLTGLNPADVESMTVLKDAASASIYGSRGANGVILITTKSGKAGEMNIEYNASYQLQQPTRMPEFVTNSADFMTYWNYANQRANQPNYFTQAEIDAFRNATDPVKYPNFNWLDHMISHGQAQNHQLSLNGGNEKTNFNFSLSYLDQDGINKAFDYQRYTMRLDLSSKLNKVVTFGTNIGVNYQQRTGPVMGANEFMLLTYTAGPNYMPRLSDGSGRWTWRYNNAAWHNRNPEQALSYGNIKNNVYSMTPQAYVDINITKDLVLGVKGAVNVDEEFRKHSEHSVASYFYSDNTLAAAATGYNVGVSDNTNRNILTTFYSTLNYTKTIAERHHLKALLGYSQESNNFRYMEGRRISFPSDNLTELNAGASNGQSLAGSSNAWAIQSLFGRVNYDWNGKYLLEANFRYDGSSRIHPDNRWGVFPSVSAGWRLSEEGFMNDIAWLDEVKLRASWGKLGNQNIGNYPYQDILQVNGYSFGSTVEQGVAQTRLTDKTLKWESTTITDLGLDLSLKSGLITFTADYFNKTTDDILYGIDIPASIGLSSPTVNYAKMKNTGFEFELGHRNTIGTFEYGASFNFSTYKNEVLRVKAPSYGTQTTIQEGLPWNSYYLTEWIGIFQSEDEIANSPKQPFSPKPGDLKFKDQNNDNVIDSKDRVVVDGAFPDFFYGGSINCAWKNFDLNAFFQGVKGQKFIVDGWGIDPFIQGSAPTKEFAANAWTPENHSNTTPAMYQVGYGAVTGTRSTYYLKNASYLRLKNLVIGYNFPAPIARKLGMKRLRIYLSGDNLLTKTKYPAADPERTGSGNFQTYPQLRVYSAGINLTF